jgi:uncharacterized protein (TIGR00290 family)
MQEQQYEVMCLLTSINEHYQRISMHGVRVELLEQQAESVALPLIKLEMPEMPSMEVYESIMETTLRDLRASGATASIFGDIFLEDLRRYREDKLSKLNLKGIFPLWKIPTSQLIEDFINTGFKAIITCVNERFLDKSFAGKIIDEKFLHDLPQDIDPCGENGEFHSFVYDGPIFRKPIPFEKGEIVHRKYEPAKQEDNSASDENNSPFATGFWYCDLIALE